MRNFSVFRVSNAPGSTRYTTTELRCSQTHALFEGFERQMWRWIERHDVLPRKSLRAGRGDPGPRLSSCVRTLSYAVGDEARFCELRGDVAEDSLESEVRIVR